VFSFSVSDSASDIFTIIFLYLQFYFIIYIYLLLFTFIYFKKINVNNKIKSMTFFKLGNDAIMFGNKETCGHCKNQDLILKKHFNSGHYIYKKIDPGKRFKNGMVIKAIPTWYIPVKNGMGYLHEGTIDGKGKIKLNKLIEKTKKRKFGFGQEIPEIGTLAKYGRNFPNGQGFNLAESWSQEINKKWGDPTLSGTLGREFGPGKIDQIYSNGYFNDIRMARPGGDLDTALNTNRSCNIYNPNPSPQGGNRDPVTYTAGMIYDSKNPQITSFGKKKRRFGFGNLYQQMGPVPASNYLLNADTFNVNYAGGGQGEPARPLKGANDKLYVNSSNVYNPVKSETSFGITRKKRHLKQLIKEKNEKNESDKVVGFVKPHQVQQKRQKVKVKVTAGPGKTLVIKRGIVKVTN
jgi:hypothetical protein